MDDFHAMLEYLISDKMSINNDEMPCKSAANPLEASLVFSEHVMAAVRAVVSLIQAGVHQEGHAATERGHAAEEEAAPKVGRVAALLVDNGWNVHFAAWTLDLDWEVEVLRPK
jgi:hypothetical protein